MRNSTNTYLNIEEKNELIPLENINRWYKSYPVNCHAMLYTQCDTLEIIHNIPGGKFLEILLFDRFGYLVQKGYKEIYQGENDE